MNSVRIPASAASESARSPYAATATSAPGRSGAFAADRTINRVAIPAAASPRATPPPTTPVAPVTPIRSAMV